MFRTPTITDQLAMEGCVNLAWLRIIPSWAQVQAAMPWLTKTNTRIVTERLFEPWSLATSRNQ
jgi:hypothetical protein